MLRWIVTTCVVALGFAACGDDDQTDAPTACPARMPADNTACGMQGLLCFYDDQTFALSHECVACGDWPYGLVTECNGRGEFRHIDRSACVDSGTSGAGGTSGGGGTGGSDVDAATSCPAQMPADQTPCATQGLLCFYGSSEGALSLSHECVACTDWPCAGFATECNGQWFAHIDRVTCEGGTGDDSGAH